MPEGVDPESVELRDGQLNGQSDGQVNGQEAAEKKQHKQHQWPDLWQPDHGEAHLVDSSGKRLLEPRALLVDAFGTLVETAEEETMVYASIGQKFGVEISPEEIGRRYEVAYRKPWLQSKLRYEGDALPFWHHIISESTGCCNTSYTQELHGYYIQKHAWRFTDPNARAAFAAIRRAGIKIALVSNFDTRLRDLLRALDCYDWFDAVAVSAEVEAEKPSAEIFHAACDMLGVLPHEVVHVGDSRNKDVAGARRAGCGAAWLWNEDVHSFTEVGCVMLGCHVLGVLPHEVVHVGDCRNTDVAGARRAGCGAAWLWNEDVHSFTEVRDGAWADGVGTSLDQRQSPLAFPSGAALLLSLLLLHSLLSHAVNVADNIADNVADNIADNVADNAADIGASQPAVVTARPGNNRRARSSPARKSRDGGSVNGTAREAPPARKDLPARKSSPARGKDLPVRTTVPASPSGGGAQKAGDPAQSGRASNTTRNRAPASADSKRAAPPPRRPRGATSGAGRRSGSADRQPENAGRQSRNATKQPENAGRQSGDAGRRSSSGSSKRRTGRRSGAPTRPVPRASPPPIQFVRLTTANNATCLDGSPPAYYYRPGYGVGSNKWLIYLMGGRWCLSPSQCRLRADTELGSSKGWPRPGNPGFENSLDSMGAGFQGMLSGDSSENPYFYSWNTVVVLYCDGGVFAGVKGKALYDHSQPYYLSGRPILNSILGDLNSKGLQRADSVLLTGCSAGAIAVSMACDAMAQFHFPRTAKVKCLMDAGFFMAVSMACDAMAQFHFPCTAKVKCLMDAGFFMVSVACDAMVQFHFPRTAKVKCLMDAGFFMDCASPVWAFLPIFCSLLPLFHFLVFSFLPPYTPDISNQCSFPGIVQRKLMLTLPAFACPSLLPPSSPLLPPHSFLPTPSSPHLPPHSFLPTPSSPLLPPHSFLPTPSSPLLPPHSFLPTPSSPPPFHHHPPF
ncbi:unnamed protein product [Closterium sp. Yama58-4]|nr:unnamed protein product [Closterium sp. Yama58-4]